MSIWTYADSAPKTDAGRWSFFALNNGNRFRLANECRWCSMAMIVHAGSAMPEWGYKGMNSTCAALLICPACGWWKVASLVAAAPFHEHDAGFCELRRVSGSLRNLDLTDLSVPIAELRGYLIARYGDRFSVHPRRYEEIVAGVFEDFGYKVRLTSYTGDEGIDVFVMDSENGETVGVQVKRYGGKISAEQIRSFIGALVLQGLTTGVYVTTSGYERGAQQTANKAQERLGLAVTLVDARRFYDALRVSTRATHWDPDDSSGPYHQYWREVSSYAAGIERNQFDEGWRAKADYVWGSSW